MKKKKKRGLLFLMSIVLGFFLAMFVGMFKALAESHGIMLDVKILIPWISAICLVLGFISILLTFNFLKKSRKFHSLYQEEMDDDLNETYYVQMYRNLEFGNIAFNITNVAILLALFISASEVVILNRSNLTLSLSFLGVVLIFNVQKYFYNDFERVMEQKFDIITQIKKDFYSNDAAFSMMSGSGTTVFAIYTDDDLRKKAYEKLKNKYKSIFLSSTSKQGVEIL